MKYMLDTNICSYIIKHRPVEVWEKFKTLQIDDCCISSITCAELRYWVARNKRLHAKSRNQGVPKINEQVINHFIAHLPVVMFDANAAAVYGQVRDSLETSGQPVGEADLFIGSHAISLNCVLVTNNVNDFKHFPDIRLENWVML